jgi:hypothetical protein
MADQMANGDGEQLLKFEASADRDKASHDVPIDFPPSKGNELTLRLGRSPPLWKGTNVHSGSTPAYPCPPVGRLQHVRCEVEGLTFRRSAYYISGMRFLKKTRNPDPSRFEIEG